MNQPYLLLWLEGPLQSWGHDSRFGRRETLNFSTKSWVLGMVCPGDWWPPDIPTRPFCRSRYAGPQLCPLSPERGAGSPRAFVARDDADAK
ncbi:CRISPR-associated protein Cas5 [Aeromonas hydrophila]|uniref:CRISPR-associated protein Cas5 n=1 Tax=Aeromonas hydrophila TaxID=644 RepID=UPI0009B890CC|nr:CRISPR-associated protein Cas5 [Aeromonas hydrophila]